MNNNFPEMNNLKNKVINHFESIGFIVIAETVLQEEEGCDVILKKEFNKTSFLGIVLYVRPDMFIKKYSVIILYRKSIKSSRTYGARISFHFQEHEEVFIEDILKCIEYFANNHKKEEENNFNFYIPTDFKNTRVFHANSYNYTKDSTIVYYCSTISGITKDKESAMYSE